MSSPLILPFLIGVSSWVPTTVPVRFPPSTLNVNVLTRAVPSGVANSAFHLPLASAATASADTNAQTASTNQKHLYLIADRTSLAENDTTLERADGDVGSGQHYWILPCVYSAVAD